VVVVVGSGGQYRGGGSWFKGLMYTYTSFRIFYVVTSRKEVAYFFLLSFPFSTSRTPVLECNSYWYPLQWDIGDGIWWCFVIAGFGDSCSFCIVG